MSAATGQFLVLFVLFGVDIAIGQFQGHSSGCLDLAIVGGGVGGTYTAYRNRNKGQRIGLFEVTSRIGGRMFTADIPTRPGSGVEFGAMRFYPARHTRLASLIPEVGLSTKDFGVNAGDTSQRLYFLRGRHLTYEELGGPKTPYNLRPNERLSPDDLLWKVFTENTNMSREAYPSEDEIYTIVTRDGQPLYTITMDQFYEQYASREAYNYIKETSTFSDVVGDFGAHLGLHTLSYPSDTSGSVLKTIREGLNSLPRRLLNIFLRSSRRHTLHVNRQLVSISRYNGRYRLRFACTGRTNTFQRQFVDVCARKVVLAMQRGSIERINFQPFTSPFFRSRLNSVIDVQALKIFIAFPYSWWKPGNGNITNANADIPSRFFEWPDDRTIKCLYLDNQSNADNWQRLQNIGRPILGSMLGNQRVTTGVVRQFSRDLSKIYRIPAKDIPWPVGGGMQIWNKFPFAAGWHYFKPGFRMAETRDYMLKPFSNHDVFLVGNSWWPNNLQGWSESALRMVDLMMERYF